MHSINDAGTSEYPDSIVLENHEQSPRVYEISTNYLDSRKSYDRKTTIVNTYFSTMIANNLQNNLDPKTMTECKQRSDWTQSNDAIQAKIVSLTKKRCIHKSNTYTSKLIFIWKWNENNEVVRYKVRLVA